MLWQVLESNGLQADSYNNLQPALASDPQADHKEMHVDLYHSIIGENTHSTIEHW